MDAQRQTTPNTTVVPKINSFRKLVMAVLKISNISITILAIYLLVTLCMDAFGLNLGNFFKFSNSSLDIMSSFGIWAILFLIILALFVVAILIAVIRVNKRYFNVLDTANSKNMKVYLAPGQTFLSALGFIFLSAILTFLSFFFLSANPTGLPAILTLICVAIILISLLLLVVLCLYNRAKFSRLNSEEQQAVRDQCANLKQEQQKNTDKEQAGKLY